MTHVHRVYDHSKHGTDDHGFHFDTKDCPACLAREEDVKKLRALLKPRVEGPYKTTGETGWFECQYCHKGISEAEGKPRDIIHRDSCWFLAAREALSSVDNETPPKD